MTSLHNKEIFKDRRRELRRRSTEEENILWKELRNSNLEFKFKRQHSIGGYILDFYCSKRKLIIEIDGDTHLSLEAKEYDEIRDKYFSELGYITLRFFNKDVKYNLSKVLTIIKKHLNPLLSKERVG